VSVSAAEPWISVGRRRGEPGDVLTRKACGLRERDVALGARGVRRGEVGGANPVTVEAPFWRSGPSLGVARGANRGFRARGGRVTHVIEA
jgi:hypothetical protein